MDDILAGYYVVGFLVGVYQMGAYWALCIRCNKDDGHPFTIGKVAGMVLGMLAVMAIWPMVLVLTYMKRGK